MSTDIKTRLANLLITQPLPDGDVAADMLIACELEEPVRMVTAPNPAKCRALIRGPFAKAATLAYATDDAGTLDKLAKHASLHVKRAVAGNRYTTAETRLAIEQLAVRRNDHGLLHAVVQGADTAYLVAGLLDPTRSKAILERFADIVRPDTSFGEWFSPSQHDLEQLCVQHRGAVPRIVAQVLGRRWPSAHDPHRLASIVGVTGGATDEVQFLMHFAANAAVIDTVVIDALRRVVDLAPEQWPTDSASVRASFKAKSIEPDALQPMLDLSVATARFAFGLNPTVEVASQIEARWGLVNLRWLSDYLANASKDAAKPLIEWYATRVIQRTADGYVFDCSSQSLDMFFAVVDPDDTDLVQALLSASPTHHTVRYVAGQLGPVNQTLARELACVHWSDVLRSVSHLRQQEWGPAMIETILTSVPLEAIATATGSSFSYLTEHELGVLLDRIVAECPNGVLESGRALVLPVFANKAFVEHVDTADADPARICTWLRVAGSVDHTLRWLGGDFRHKPERAAVDSLVMTPGSALTTMPHQILARQFDAIADVLTDEQLDLLVDACGPEVLRWMLNSSRSGAAAFAAYLAGRLQRSTADSGEWTTALELLTKNSVPIGTALTGARRLAKMRQR